MSTPTVSWSEALPVETDYIRAGDDRIRELKTQIREVITVDHEMDSSGQDTDWGYHNQVTLLEQADIGTGAVGIPILGAQTVVEPELCYTDEIDRDVILTDKGKIALQNGRLPNATNLLGRNAAGNADVNILIVNADNVVEFVAAPLFSGGILLEEVAVPTTAANEGALYTKNDGTQTELYFREESAGDELQLTKGGSLNIPFGAWLARAGDTVYLAATDGFVTAWDTSRGSAYIYSDGSTPPTTARAYTYAGESEAATQYVMCPVRKGDYWKATGFTNVFWLPLGT